MLDPSSVTSKDLKNFSPFQQLDEHQLLLWTSNVELRHVPRGACLFNCGDVDSSEFFLLRGALELCGIDGQCHLLDARDSSARDQIARLRPRQFRAMVRQAADVIVIDKKLLADLQSSLRLNEDSGYGVNEVASLDEAESCDLLHEFNLSLQQNKVTLPSLPEVALRVRELLDADEAGGEEIAAVINADPAIAAKLIRAANCPLFYGNSKCDTTRNAIVRLGLANTKQLILSFAVHDLFKVEKPQLKRRMQKAWMHSVEVAAISFVICRMMKSFSVTPEEMLLMGLLHDIGVIAVLGYIANKPELLADEGKIDALIDRVRADAGAEILTRWQFSPVFVEVARQACDWQRQHAGDADAVDIIQVAKLHSYMHHHQPIPMSSVDLAPAFHRLPMGDLTPELTIEILQQSRPQIHEAKSLLLG